MGSRADVERALLGVATVQKALSLLRGVESPAALLARVRASPTASVKRKDER
jgi:hypothetical protein